jgi:hypothetical protein
MACHIEDAAAIMEIQCFQGKEYPDTVLFLYMRLRFFISYQYFHRNNVNFSGV